MRPKRHEKYPVSGDYESCTVHERLGVADSEVSIS